MDAETLLTNLLVSGKLVRGGDGEEVRQILRDALKKEEPNGSTD